MQNAIERRLSQIEQDWSLYAADEDTRLIKWLGSVDDLGMVELFFELQNEDGSNVPDLVLRFSTDFQSRDQYGDALARTMREEYETSAEELADEGVNTWKPVPQLDPKAARPHDALVVTLQSFCDNFGVMFERLALVLTPAVITDDDEFESWLRQCLSLPFPPAVLFVVLCPPQNDGFLASNPDDELPVRTIPLSLDMPSAVEELAKNEGEDGPGKAFRLQFLAIGNAGKTRNSRAARRAARAARKIARKEGWVDQEVVIHLSLGSALLACETPKDAAKVYANAADLSHHLMRNRHPGGQSLLLTSLMSEGAAHYSAENYDAAAQTYQKTGHFAQEIEDHPAAIDAWRMASFCCAQDKQHDQAWVFGERALDVGALVEESDRPSTTLSHAGEMLLHFCESGAGSDEQAYDVTRRMKQLLGPDWSAPSGGDVIG